MDDQPKLRTVARTEPPDDGEPRLTMIGTQYIVSNPFAAITPEAAVAFEAAFAKVNAVFRARIVALLRGESQSVKRT